MAKAFVSYAGKDIRIVTRIANDLAIRSSTTLFIAQWDIAAGESLVERIELALLESDYFVPLLSQNFLASDFAQRELRSATTLAISKKVRVVPVKIGDCGLPPLLADLKYIDFTTGVYDSALDALVHAITPTDEALRSLDDLVHFLVTGDHTPESLVTLAMDVLKTSWTPDDDRGKGAQRIAQKLENLGCAREALRVYDAAIGVFPHVVPLRMLRSAVYRHLDDFASADGELGGILDADADNVRALVSRFWVNHDWRERLILPVDRQARERQARECVERLQSAQAARTTYVHAYLHVLAQGAVLFRQESFAEEARQLLLREKERIEKSGRGRDRDAVLKTYRILEGFYRESGDPDVAELLEMRRHTLEDMWQRVLPT